MKPRMPNSPSAVPTMARARTPGGAIVSTSAIAGSAILRSQATSPVALSIANMRPSKAIEITLSFHSATPRLLTPQQATSPAQARSVPGSIFHLMTPFLPFEHSVHITGPPAFGRIEDAFLNQGCSFEIPDRIAPAALEAAQRDRE